MSNGIGMIVLDENIFAHVELFILEEEVHRFQEWIEENVEWYSVDTNNVALGRIALQNIRRSI